MAECPQGACARCCWQRSYVHRRYQARCRIHQTVTPCDACSPLFVQGKRFWKSLIRKKKLLILSYARGCVANLKTRISSKSFVTNATMVSQRLCEKTFLPKVVRPYGTVPWSSPLRSSVLRLSLSQSFPYIIVRFWVIGCGLWHGLFYSPKIYLNL